MADVFERGASGPNVGTRSRVKSLHAKIGELVLENDFLGTCARQGAISERKAMIDRHHKLALTKQAALPRHQPMAASTTTSAGVCADCDERRLDELIWSSLCRCGMCAA